MIDDIGFPIGIFCKRRRETKFSKSSLMMLTEKWIVFSNETFGEILYNECRFADILFAEKNNIDFFFGQTHRRKMTFNRTIRRFISTHSSFSSSDAFVQFPTLCINDKTTRAEMSFFFALDMQSRERERKYLRTMYICFSRRRRRGWRSTKKKEEEEEKSGR